MYCVYTSENMQMAIIVYNIFLLFRYFDDKSFECCKRGSFYVETLPVVEQHHGSMSSEAVKKNSKKLSDNFDVDRANIMIWTCDNNRMRERKKPCFPTIAILVACSYRSIVYSGYIRWYCTESVLCEHSASGRPVMVVRRLRGLVMEGKSRLMKIYIKPYTLSRQSPSSVTGKRMSTMRQWDVQRNEKNV